MFAIPLLPIVLFAFYLGGLTIGIIVALMFFIASLLVYRMSPKIMLRWYGARRLSNEQYAFVSSHLSELSSKMGFSSPEPYIFDSTAPIVFTVGANDKYYLLISDTSLDMLNEDELKSILALEIAKISKGTVPLNTIAALFAGIIAAFSTVALWLAMLTGFGQEDDPAPRSISFLAMGMVSLPSALIVHLFSINSTMETDRIAAEMVSDTYVLAEALKRLGTYTKLHVNGGFNPGHAHLFSVNPLKSNTIFDVYSSMFITKPDINQRATYLENIKSAGQL